MKFLNLRKFHIYSTSKRSSIDVRSPRSFNFGIGVNSIHAGIMAVEASTKSNLVNNFDDDDDDGPVFFKRNDAASRQNQVNPDVRKPSSSTFNGQNSNAQKGYAGKHDGDQPAT
ncbi:hypothetical protein Q3G72_034787 [Acer saccharum]|nr:hypothetical protein Q3G72_034787 [Acer saccharum]